MPSLLLLRRAPPPLLLRRWRSSSAASEAPPASSTSAARSFRDVARVGAAVSSLQLPQSPDLVCRNLMCEHVGDACACRLSLVLERVPQLQRLDLSNNALRALPASTFSLQELTQLDASHNQLTALPDAVAQLQALERLDLRANALQSLPVAALAALPRLQELQIARNPVLLAALETQELRLPPELRAKLVLNEEDAAAS
ncbi:hypothetical protein BBJ28_00015798 [Nothophytophthora sp. Chile5]|nr:hypothetical protein BBJ28_00015798 [Nothophytophthora sp. Chile5]